MEQPAPEHDNLGQLRDMNGRVSPSPHAWGARTSDAAALEETGIPGFRPQGVPYRMAVFVATASIRRDVFPTREFEMKIRPSTQKDIRQFRVFWDSAVDYQKARRLPLWPAFPENNVRDEIRNGLHFSCDAGDGDLMGYFSVALSDELIWGEEERGDAIYIHRMCVNPKSKGNNLARSVLAWAYGYASRLERKFIRMDTWADNQRLVNYYVDCGFHYIGQQQLEDVAGLPSHYCNTRLALFQNNADRPRQPA